MGKSATIRDLRGGGGGGGGGGGIRGQEDKDVSDVFEVNSRD